MARITSKREQTFTAGRARGWQDCAKGIVLAKLRVPTDVMPAWQADWHCGYEEGYAQRLQQFEYEAKHGHI